MFVYGANGLDTASSDMASRMNGLNRRALDQRGLRSIFRKAVDGMSDTVTFANEDI